MYKLLLLFFYICKYITLYSEDFSYDHVSLFIILFLLGFTQNYFYSLLNKLKKIKHKH